MRKQIAAANWKMNLEKEQATELLEKLTKTNVTNANAEVVIAVPFPYLLMAGQISMGNKKFHIAAQNCSQYSAGAYTGEVSANMLRSCEISYVIVGHSERREIFHEDNKIIASKVDRALERGLHPIFCCGEPLEVRQSNGQNSYVEKQLRDSLFHLKGSSLEGFVIAYEPIWSIGTGKTATAEEAQLMHAHIRQVVAGEYGNNIADSISILYGGSVKASNSREMFSQPDVDGGLVGGASLNAEEFEAIIASLKA